MGESSMMPMRGIFADCCPRARLILTASNRPTPPLSAANSRRLMSDMGCLLPRSATSNRRTLLYAQPSRRLQLLGPDLNCSESGVGGRPRSDRSRIAYRDGADWPLSDD